MNRSLKNKKVLITCGPTWVPIDAMRVISNQSTGALGQMIAKDFASAGACVTLLEGPVARQMESKSIKVVKFVFFDEFTKLIKKELKKKYDICIHAAAVSDYQSKKPARTKLSSQLAKLTLELVPTQKIIHLIKKLNPKLFLVGFKLEPKMTAASAVSKSQTLFKVGKCDLVVANSLNGSKYCGYIVEKSGDILAHAKTRKKISENLMKLLAEINN